MYAKQQQQTGWKREHMILVAYDRQKYCRKNFTFWKERERVNIKEERETNKTRDRKKRERKRCTDSHAQTRKEWQTDRNRETGIWKQEDKSYKIWS